MIAVIAGTEDEFIWWCLQHPRAGREVRRGLFENALWINTVRDTWGRSFDEIERTGTWKKLPNAVQILDECLYCLRPQPVRGDAVKIDL